MPARLHTALALLPLAAALQVSRAHAQDTATATPFTLGQVEVQATTLDAGAPGGTSNVVISADDMADQGTMTVADALGNVAGVVPTFTGKRNEGQVAIRGFSARQITLNVDGIPIYVPYDGNIDLSRLLVPGISRIVVTKGLGSLMYGPNNMGGSINIVTRAPTRRLEGRVSAGLSAGAHGLAGSNVSAEAGSRLDPHWYLQGGVAVYDVNTFPLSHAFKAVPAQPAGNRRHAASHDVNANLKLGFTPNATDEYAVGLYTVRSDKQSPPYTGTVQRVSYWNWPQWDKTTLYYIGKTAVGRGYLKTRLYHDGSVNRLNSYDDAGYDTTFRPYTFLSKYDDYSDGASAELGQPLGSRNFIKAAAFYKIDVHRETQYATTHNPVDSPWLKFRTHTQSLGLEDTLAATDRTTIVAGYRYDRHAFDRAERYAQPDSTGIASWPLAGSQGSGNAQLVVSQRLDGMVLRAGIGRKTRFPGIKDMYSSRLGSAVPNPVLGAERALNREVGVSGKLPGGGDYDVSVYWDSIDNAIELVPVAPQLPFCVQNCRQNQNVGGARNRGVDVTAHLPLGSSVMLTVNYGYLDATLAAPGLVATNAPRHAASLSASWYATSRTELLADVRAMSARDSATDGSQPVAGYAVANLRLIERLDERWSLNAGIYNLFDRDYAITEGFPMPGRTVRLQASYRL